MSDRQPCDHVPARFGEAWLEDWDESVGAHTVRIRSLIERSGAAKALFPTERVPADRQRPQAIAQ